MQLVFLGTSGSWPTLERNVSAVALKLGKEIILFDCGEGTQRQFMKSTLSFMQISKILISHFHADHFLGLSGLIQTMAFNNRQVHLEIYGPEGIEELVSSFMNLGYSATMFEIRVCKLNDNDILEFDDYKIIAKAAEHNVPNLAYALEEYERPGKFDLRKAKSLGIPEGPLYRKLQQGQEIKLGTRTIKPEMVLGPPRKGRKIVYTGDTRFSEKIIELAKDCDVLIHDATVEASLDEQAKEFGHSTTKEAALIAKKANAKILFLTHISPRYEDAQLLEKEAKEIFEHSQIAEDFMEYEVRYSE